MENRIPNGAALLKPNGCLVQVILNVQTTGISIESPLDAGNVLLVLEKAKLAIVQQAPIRLPEQPRMG